jgi:hypothetical protein
LKLRVLGKCAIHGDYRTNFSPPKWAYQSNFAILIDLTYIPSAFSRRFLENRQQSASKGVRDSMYESWPPANILRARWCWFLGRRWFKLGLDHSYDYHRDRNYCCTSKKSQLIERKTMGAFSRAIFGRFCGRFCWFFC